MELFDPLVYKVLLYMRNHPEGVCIEDVVGLEKADEVEEVLAKYGLIEQVGTEYR